LGRDDAEDEHELDPRQESGEGGQSPGHAAAEDEGDGGTADEELGGAEADEITDPLGEPAPGDPPEDAGAGDVVGEAGVVDEDHTDNEEEGAERHHRPAVAASLLFGELTEAIHCDRAPGRGPLCLFYHTLPGRAESDATRSGGPFLAFSWQALCSRRRPARH